MYGRNGNDPVIYLEFAAVLALVGYPVVRFARWLKRRSTLREFAATHGLRVRGMLPSDKYEPYRRFRKVRQAVLLYNVMEGHWKDFEIALFDFPRQGTWTGVIVSVPNDHTQFEAGPGLAAPRVGSRTAAALRSDPSMFAETQVGYLYASPQRLVGVDALPELLGFALTVARALNDDGQERDQW